MIISSLLSPSKLTGLKIHLIELIFYLRRE
nr:MAG TPA: hypothetical protein [Caudoviricetes sp.]